MFSRIILHESRTIVPSYLRTFVRYKEFINAAQYISPRTYIMYHNGTDAKLSNLNFWDNIFKMFSGVVHIR